jgi:cell division septal protein FtsQ
MRLGRKVEEPVRRSAAQDTYSFRRSRTITGSTSSGVRTVGEQHSQLKSPRLHEHTLRRHRRKLLLYLGVALLASGSLWYLVSQYIGESIQASPVITQSELRINTKKYEDLVHAYLNEHPFERFAFALNPGSLDAYIVAKSPEVKHASMTKSEGLGNGELSLTFRQPVAAWTIQQHRYFVDAEGTIFTENYFSTPPVTVVDKSGINADAGVIASNKLLHFIGRLVTLIDASGAGIVETIELPPSSTREVDVHLVDKPFSIKTNLDRDPAGQAMDVKNAISYVNAHQITPQYLDLRVSSKAYYR